MTNYLPYKIMKKILVIGSLNMDLVTMAKRHPKLGETIIGKSFFQIPGGKGGNQAVSIAKLGGNVTMFGCVGKDSHGQILINELEKNNAGFRKVPGTALKNAQTGETVYTPPQEYDT
ncbi:MAG: PfkB family carbohydrate kinase, partial [Fusobacterium sp.]